MLIWGSKSEILSLMIIYDFHLWLLKYICDEEISKKMLKRYSSGTNISKAYKCVSKLPLKITKSITTKI